MAKEETKGGVMVEDTIKEQNEKAETLKAKRVAKDAAKQTLREFFAKHPEYKAEKEAVMTLVNIESSRRTATGTSNVNSVIRKMFIDKEVVSELDIYKAFKLGRPGMNAKCRDLLKVSNPDDRVWVRFVESGDKLSDPYYELVSIGAATPDGWGGYNPNVKKASL